MQIPLAKYHCLRNDPTLAHRGAPYGGEFMKGLNAVALVAALSLAATAAFGGGSGDALSAK